MTSTAPCEKRVQRIVEWRVEFCMRTELDKNRPGRPASFHARPMALVHSVCCSLLVFEVHWRGVSVSHKIDGLFRHE